MKLTPFVLMLTLIPQTDVRAQGHEGHERAPHVVVRAAPPKYVAHPPGAHPHGAMVRPHQVRIMAPKVIAPGAHAWRHWEHPDFSRPVYYWDWTVVHHVTCTAEDSYGDQYPVTQAWTRGWGLDNMTTVEDEAMDRCYNESGSDESCYLIGCSHF
jgi:hypothetical protein